MSQIDEIAVVRQDVFRLETIFITILFEESDTFFRQWFAYPLALILGEQSKRVCSYFMRIYGGEFYAAGCIVISIIVWDDYVVYDCKGNEYI